MALRLEFYARASIAVGTAEIRSLKVLISVLLTDIEQDGKHYRISFEIFIRFRDVEDWHGDYSL